MTSISSIGGGGWSAYGSTSMPRPPGGKDGAQMKEDLFAKIDSNGDSSIDADELAAMAEATGSSGASDWFKTAARQVLAARALQRGRRHVLGQHAASSLSTSLPERPRRAGACRPRLCLPA